MVKKLEYEVIETDDTLKLAKQVNRKIEEGWEPLGGVSVSLSKSMDDRYFTCAHAMVKHIKKIV